jgi:hypothetical protein
MGLSANEDDTRALFTYDISSLWGKEYVDVMYDSCRMIVIQIVIQSLMTMTSPTAYPFFSAEFVLLCIYVILGVLVYWLIFKKLVQFK